MLYCQPSALPVFAWSSTSDTPLPPLSVYQRRTPGRSAYPANCGLEVCAADAITMNNDPACRPRSAAALKPISIRCVPFIRLLQGFNLSVPVHVSPTGVSRGSFRKQTGPYPDLFGQTVSNTVAWCQLETDSNRNARPEIQEFP